MNSNFGEVREILIGLKSCFVRVGYGSQLKLGLGEKIFYNKPSLKGKFYGEWDILSQSCVWRILKDGNILCGYGDEIEYCNKILEPILPSGITDVLQIAQFDFRILFETGIIIDYLCESVNGTVLSVLDNKNKIEFELTFDGWEKSNSANVFGKLTEIESFLSEHSKGCQNRWENLVTVKEFENNCKDCFYFRGITGGFYFWDYGICSNGKSKYDGTLVNVESGCNFFNYLKDILKDH